MKSYQESNLYQGATGGGGFNPVKEPDVASRLQSAFQTKESADVPYWNSLSAQQKTKVDNAQQWATEQNDQLEKNLKAISSLSKTVGKMVDQAQVNKIKAKMDAASEKALMEPLYAEKETEAFEVGERQVDEGQAIMDEAAADYEANGGSPIIGEKLRHNFTGNEKLAYERTRLSMLSQEYPNFMARRLEQINATQDEGERARRLAEAHQEWRDTTGIGALNQGMTNKYLYRTMRQIDAKAEQQWITKTEAEIKAGRVSVVENDLAIQVDGGQVVSGVDTARASYMQLGYSQREADKMIFDQLNADERRLSPSQVRELEGADASGHPGCPKDGPCTFGKVYRRQLNELKGKVANNINQDLENLSNEQKAAQKELEMTFETDAQTRLEQGQGRYTNDEVSKMRETLEGKGYKTKFLDDYVTTEEFDAQRSKDRLLELGAEQGFLTQNDLKDAPIEVRNDDDIKNLLKGETLLSGQTDQQENNIEARAKGIATTATGYTSTSADKADVYQKTLIGVRKDLMSRYMANLKSGKYRNAETGAIDYDLALSDAADAVNQGIKSKQNPNGWDYSQQASQTEQATRGSSAFIERVQLHRDGMRNQDNYLNTNVIATESELEQAAKAAKGQGNWPAVYEELAQGQINVTPYDIHMAQQNALKVKTDPEPVEEALRKQDPYLQRMLTYKPNVRKTERAFTTNQNAPGVVDPNVAVYTTGNIGPTSTGQHLDVKRADGSYFEYGDLDGFVEVGDKDLGRVPLSRVPQTGDWDSHTVRGSHGRDYGTYDGSPIYLVNGARVVDTVGTVHGDRLQIELPNGKRYFFLHGTSRPVKVLPKTEQPQQSTTMSKQLTKQEVGTTLEQAGWPTHLIPTMIGVAGGESGRNTGADTRTSGLDPQGKREISIGLLQINYKVHKDLVHSMGYTEADLRDPVKNAKVGLRIYQMQGLGAWGAYTNGSFRDHL
jgi:hypothetical protein